MERRGQCSLRESFQNAFNGLCYCLRTQRNMRLHILAAILVLLVAYFLQISRTDLILLFLTLTLVLAAEIFNTAVEKAVDLKVSEYHFLAKTAKDLAAGAVLVTALNALVTGVLIFWPYLQDVFAK